MGNKLTKSKKSKKNLNVDNKISKEKDVKDKKIKVEKNVSDHELNIKEKKKTNEIDGFNQKKVEDLFENYAEDGIMDFEGIGEFFDELEDIDTMEEEKKTSPLCSKKMLRHQQTYHRNRSC
eukprot:TRINITY_DN47214_c0_g1_i2.p1 TRINITY_DN47214_c0_g1~~TRINITY_DN47214_c0_g1_i2.p1  ORF type:complete len:121 (+),score=20.35 TRINITY_DN47214_c0_g1_i2:40-402(+)